MVVEKCFRGSVGMKMGVLRTEWDTDPEEGNQ